MIKIKLIKCQAYLQETLAIFSIIRRYDFQTGTVGVPRCVTLRMLSSHTSRTTIGSSGDLIKKNGLKLLKTALLFFFGYLKTMGTLTVPPDMAKVLAAELITCRINV